LSQIPSISDAFRVIVQNTEAAIIADSSLDWGTLPKKVYFMHGHPREIVGVLQSYTNSPDFKNKKYPLVILVRDIEDEEAWTGQEGFDIPFQCRIFICTLTTPTLRAPDRETQNFKPILHPILFNLCNQISLSDRFGMPTPEDMKIKWTDRYYWGADVVDKNKLNDYIDAVEVKTMSLRLYNLHCTFTNNF
jgi:hypothetical protein